VVGGLDGNSAVNPSPMLSAHDPLTSPPPPEAAENVLGIDGGPIALAPIPDAPNDTPPPILRDPSIPPALLTFLLPLSTIDVALDLSIKTFRNMHTGATTDIVPLPTLSENEPLEVEVVFDRRKGYMDVTSF
jgi:hypothetical protein